MTFKPVVIPPLINVPGPKVVPFHNAQYTEDEPLVYTILLPSDVIAIPLYPFVVSFVAVNAL